MRHEFFKMFVGIYHELAVLDRKIPAELAPKHDEKDGEEVKRDGQSQSAQRVDTPAQSTGSMESMVTEPVHIYQSLAPTIRTAYRPTEL